MPTHTIEFSQILHWSSYITQFRSEKQPRPFLINQPRGGGVFNSIQTHSDEEELFAASMMVRFSYWTKVRLIVTSWTKQYCKQNIQVVITLSPLPYLLLNNSWKYLLQCTYLLQVLRTPCQTFTPILLATTHYFLCTFAFKRRSRAYSGSRKKVSCYILIMYFYAWF